MKPERGLRDLKEEGIYEAKEHPHGSGSIENGKVVANLPTEVEHLLSTISNKEKGANASDDDFRAMCLLIEAGISPQDAYATFMASHRGSDIFNRKAGHEYDYMGRTIERAVANVGNQKDFDFSLQHNAKGSRITKSGIVEERLDRIQPQKTNWVWRNYIPAGRITIVAGDPGLGKSQIGVDLVSRISRGDGMPDGNAGRTSGTCAIATAEDHTAETIVPRVIAAEGNLKRIRVVRKVNIDGDNRYLSLPRDIQRIYEYIKQGNLRMFVIDPLSAFMGAALDTYKDHDVRHALTPVEEVAEETNCAVLVIGHLNKKEDAATLYRVGGSIGFIGAARSVLAVSQANEDEMRVLYSLKSNLSKRPPALSYQIDEVQLDEDIPISRVTWHGQSDFDPQKAGKNDGPQMQKECFEFCKEMFRESSEVLAVEIEENAKAAGIPMITLKRYKPKFRIGSKRIKDEWYWVEPEGGL
jgi:hypothetical protein